MSYNYYYPLNKDKNGSETSFSINLTALIIAVLCLIPFRFAGEVDLNYVFVLFAIIITISSVGLEYLFYREASPLGHLKIQRKISFKRVAYREVALLVTFLCIRMLYALFPMFTYDSFQFIYFPFLDIIIPALIVASVPYFCLMDKLDPEEEDIYCKIGYAITHFKKTVTKFELGDYMRSWLVKAFWLSLMEPYMIEKLKWFVNYDWDMMKDNPVEWFWTLNVICFFIDLAYASVGYLINFKIINTHTRTAEPTFFGWVVAVMCYWPFWDILFYNMFFAYGGGNKWLNIFETESFLWWVWFVAVIGLEFLYSMATVAGGIRFSNLTYRGLWNTGPYKWTKHPAYVFKNISWWLISMPFIAEDWQTGLKCCVLLFGLNIIYYLRAKTEERHLSHYPEYVEYALKMNDKSIFRWAAKILPLLKYKPLNEKERVF